MTDWRAERRADRKMELDARLAAQVTQREQARADQSAQREQDRADRADKARRAAARRAALGAWVRGHTMDMLFVPVILIPAVLAWSAMADYGREVFGPLGVALPGFTEFAMWAFAFAVPMALRAGRPAGWLHVGVWVFAAVAGGLNFLHGAATSVGHGVVMALVSVGGVVVHQLITARPPGPRPSRAQRDAARVARHAARRATAVWRAAVRHAVAELDVDGTARLVFQPGTVRLTRSWWGRRRLVPATVPGLCPPPLPEVDPAVETLAAEISTYLAGMTTAPGWNTPGTGSTPSGMVPPVLPADLPERIARRVPELLDRVRSAITTGELPQRPNRTEVQKFLRVRAEVAIAVHNALYGDSDGNAASEAVA